MRKANNITDLLFGPEFLLSLILFVAILGIIASIGSIVFYSIAERELVEAKEMNINV